MAVALLSLISGAADAVVAVVSCGGGIVAIAVVVVVDGGIVVVGVVVVDGRGGAVVAVAAAVVVVVVVFSIPRVKQVIYIPIFCLRMQLTSASFVCTCNLHFHLFLHTTFTFPCLSCFLFVCLSNRSVTSKVTATNSSNNSSRHNNTREATT